MIELSFVGKPKDLMRYIGEQICEECLGEGVVYFMEQDNDGNFANTGVKTCYCRMQDWNDRGEEQ